MVGNPAVNPRRGVLVRVPGLLRSYTAGAATLALDPLPAGATVDDALRAIDARCPGLRFRLVDEQQRIRRHIRIFIAGVVASGVDVPVRDGDEIMIVGALSGGD
jgi:molybdopterin converting factor small subunit